MDDDEVMYRRQRNGKHHIVVPQSLIKEVIAENHNPKFVAHPSMKRTYNLISLSYWWQNMRNTIQKFIRDVDLAKDAKKTEIISCYKEDN